MDEYWKGFIVGFLVACLLAVAVAVNAGEAENLMRDKVPLFAGECAVTVGGMLTKDPSKRVKSYGCAVWKDLAEPDDVLWFFFSDDNGYFQVIRLNGADDTQEIKWKRGQVGA